MFLFELRNRDIVKIGCFVLSEPIIFLTGNYILQTSVITMKKCEKTGKTYIDHVSCIICLTFYVMSVF